MDEMRFVDVIIMAKYIKFSGLLEFSHIRELMRCQLWPYLKDKDTPASELWPTPIDDEVEHTTEIANEDVEWYNKFVQNYKKGNK